MSVGLGRVQFFKKAKIDPVWLNFTSLFGYKSKLKQLIRRCCFHTTSSVSSSFRCRLRLASTFVFALASWIRPLLRMIIMIIAELSGRCRQSPIALGGEGQSFGTKDTLSIGPLDTHWSHVFINLDRYIFRKDAWAFPFNSVPVFWRIPHYRDTWSDDLVVRIFIYLVFLLNDIQLSGVKIDINTRQ